MPRYVAKRGRYSASGDYSRHSGHAQPADGASGTAHRGLHANNDDVENANLTRRMAPAGTRALVLGTLERILARAGGCVNRFRVLLNLYEQQPAANAVGAAPLGTLHLVAKPSAMRLSLALYSAQPGATLCALASLSGFDHFPLEHLLTRMSVVLNARPRSSVTVDLQRHCAPLLRSVEFDVELAVRLPPRTLLFSRAQSAALDALLARTELQVPRVRVHEPALKPAAWACRGDARAVADNSSDGGDQSFAGVAGLTPLQLSALTWMTWRESDSGPSLHEASTRRFAFFGGGALEFDVLSRHFALRAVDDAPPSTRGGVLATDAGVGGRADVLAALLARDFDTGASSLATELRRTLIVVSAETLDYWASVLRLSLAQRVPWTVCRRRGQHGGRACVDHSLLSKPVLLTTYGALAANQASLTRVDWHRVAFDCVAALKPGESMRDVVLRKLRAANRWVLAPNASRAFTLVGSRRPMRTIARLLLPHNQEWTRALATDEEHELQAEDGTRDANWGATARALVYFQANAGDGFVAQSIEPLLFDPSDDERRVLQAVQQRKVTLLAHRARRLHSQEPDAGDSDDSDENDQQLSVLQVLHDVTSVTAQPRQALTCTCDEHVLQRARRPNQSQQLSSAASSPGEPTQLSNSDACVAEQELQWAEAVHERHGQCAICLDEPTDAVLTQCVASLSSSSSSSLSENDSQDDGDAAQQQQAGASAARADDAQRADQPQTPAVARHFFCFRCLAAALHRQKQHDERKTCPMCRASLRQANNMIRLRRVEIAGSGGLFEWQRVPLQLGMYHHMRLQHSTRNDLDDMEDDALQRSIGVVSSAPFAQLSRTKALCSFVAQRPRGSVLVITRFDKQVSLFFFLLCAFAANKTWIDPGAPMRIGRGVELRQRMRVCRYAFCHATAKWTAQRQQCAAVVPNRLRAFGAKIEHVGRRTRARVGRHAGGVPSAHFV